MNKSPIITKTTKTVYQNRWITVREDEIIHASGNPGIYSVVESRDSVIIAVLDERNRVLLIRNFSYPAQKWHWELPGGSCDDEGYIEASKRELAEETGVAANNWQLLGETRVCDGFMTERMATLLARDLHAAKLQQAEDSHVIAETKFVELGTAYEMVQSGEVDEGQTLTALYLLEHYLSCPSS
jgi:8-oxo-dGTP pyrophosphatase MutT (NUDIX family)